LKKIKEFFFSNVFVRPKVIICWTIVTMGILIVALLLTGCGEQNLFLDVGPEWSPDGSKIAFGSGAEEKFDIWVMNADGSNKINLTGN